VSYWEEPADSELVFYIFQTPKITKEICGLAQ